MKLVVFASLLVLLPYLADAGSCVGKNVDVWVINGHDLTGDGLQSPDPYVKVRIGSDQKKTRVIPSDAYPVWYEKLHFKRASTDLMVIEVWDADTLTEDDHLGTCMEPLETSGKQWRKVVCKTTADGEVRLFYRCS